MGKHKEFIFRSKKTRTECIFPQEIEDYPSPWKDLLSLGKRETQARNLDAMTLGPRLDFPESSLWKITSTGIIRSVFFTGVHCGGQLARFFLQIRFQVAAFILFFTAAPAEIVPAEIRLAFRLFRVEKILEKIHCTTPWKIHSWKRFRSITTSIRRIQPGSRKINLPWLRKVTQASRL
jgi:hypothetical protein